MHLLLAVSIAVCLRQRLLQCLDVFGAMQRMEFSLAIPFVVLLLLVQLHPAFATVPYTPSHLLASPPRNESLVYLLLPDSTGGKEHTGIRFLSLDASQTVDAENPNFNTLLDLAPFHSDDHTAAFVPVIDQLGTIKVYAGGCQNTSGPGVVWQFDPDADSSIGNGTWKSLSIDAATGNHGPNYLTAGFAYAVTDTLDSSVYTFGGMCPWQHNTITTNWVSTANYSQAMTVLDPSSDGTSYHLDYVGQRAPPIAEAGLSITPLQPYTTTKSTKGGMPQQQDFLFVGGQTQQAFLNMSELAIYSLPQDSWSFVSVESDSDGAKTELAVRDTSQMVDSRSGHTAVLSPDGSKVIIVGGWVGNTSVPANPQLAILEVGPEYGGYGSWNWNIPSLEDSFLADGTGIYGHGTAMLPGGVLMIAGGYRISQSSKRSTAENPQIHFYNVTSNTWATSYTNPNWQDANASQTGSGSSSYARKVGLGVGLGVGIPILLGVALLAWKFSRKYRFRQSRDNELRKLALGAQRSHFWGRDEPEMASSIRAPSLGSDRSYPWSSNRGNQGKSKSSDNADPAVAERTGLLMDGLSSTKSNRQRPSYRFQGQTGERIRSNPAGNIHPIDEREEYEASASDSLIAHDPNPAPGVLDVVDIPDPFIEAPFLTPQSTFNNSTNRGQENTRAALEENAFLASAGSRTDDEYSTPSSSDKAGRPHSNQSDSPIMMRLGVVPKSRATILHNSMTPPGNGRHSPYKSVAASTHSKETRARADSATTHSSDKRHSSDSFSTAYTSFSQRQAEGEHLLPEALEVTPEESPPELAPIELPPKVAATSRPKASEWLGNVRRVLSGTRKWIPDKDSSANKNNISAAPLAPGIDRRKTVFDSNRTSRQDDEFVPPRRAVSASADLFRRKQGARDWGASDRTSRDTVARTPYDSAELDEMLDPNDDTAGEEEEDWDIDTAAEGRRVQIAFTVPKERLRVVNATAKDMDSMSEGSLKKDASRRSVSG